MIVATIHRNEIDNVWVVLVKDTIRETRNEYRADTVAEAEAIAEREGSAKTKVSMR
jgi:hypothetical protein